MKTNRDLRLHCGPPWPFEIPKGTPVSHGPRDGMGNQTYIIDNPRPFGVCEHDAKHRYMYVPADAVDTATT